MYVCTIKKYVPFSHTLYNIIMFVVYNKNPRLSDIYSHPSEKMVVLCRTKCYTIQAHRHRYYTRTSYNNIVNKRGVLFPKAIQSQNNTVSGHIYETELIWSRKVVKCNGKAMIKVQTIEVYENLMARAQTYTIVPQKGRREYGDECQNIYESWMVCAACKLIIYATGNQSEIYHWMS